jgi:hypothetical protein
MSVSQSRRGIAMVSLISNVGTIKEVAEDQKWVLAKDHVEDQQPKTYK